jgi:hypothetical protein
MRIQLLTFPGCPHAHEARLALGLAISRAGLAARIEELDTTSPLTPPGLRLWSSPTILVEGRDVGGEIAPLVGGCRLYLHEDGELRGAPQARVLDTALRRASPALAG